MEKYIYINYAYEDQQQVLPIIRQMKDMGINVCYGNSSEDKVAGSVCVIHFCTAASHISRSYRKIMNYTLKHELDSMLFHLKNQEILSDVEMQLDVLYMLFKYKYRAAVIPAEASEQHSEQQPELVSEQKTDNQEQGTVSDQRSEKTVSEVMPEQGTKELVPEAVAKQDTAASENVSAKDELFRQGRRWMTGDGCDVDVDKAFTCFRQAASQGHTEAQYQLSVCYDRGIGVRRSIAEAAKWCQMAAYGGHAQAQSEIGYCYEYGQGVVRNIKEAVRWYEIASEQGNIEAKNNLAFCYQKGKGVIKDVQKAIRLYREAADAGHASAQYNLGFCYWYGEGIKTDKEKAIELFRQSAANGNAKAGQMLKILNQHAFMRK